MKSSLPVVFSLVENEVPLSFVGFKQARKKWGV